MTEKGEGTSLLTKGGKKVIRFVYDTTYVDLTPEEQELVADYIEGTQEEEGSPAGLAVTPRIDESLQGTQANW